MVMLVMMLVMAVVPVIYSYLYYKKHKPRKHLPINFYPCTFCNNASCNTCEKFTPLAVALSLSHAGIVKVFFTAFVSLY